LVEEFEGRDLSGAVFWGVNLTGARLRDVNMTSVRISHARLVDVDIDGFVDAITINGVDVTQWVNERDPWYPLRAMLRPTEPDDMRDAWDQLQQRWDATIRRAERLTEDQRHESIGGEWSFVQTLRHLIFAMDKWFTAPILGKAYHPIGLPNTGSADFGWPGLDRDADPTFGEALAVRTERAVLLRDYLTLITQAELSRQVEVLENGTTPVDECLFTVFEEEFEHNRYATRDLAHFD
jgi:DinB superfamily/Pentapeptide repeats (8 copies)